MSGWQPIHENHAIDVMAAVISFVEPIPERALARALRAGQDAAFQAGLRSRHSAAQMGFVVGPDGAMQVAPQTGKGFLFNSIFGDAEGAPIPGRLSEQLQITATAITYRTWNYVSWSWQRARLLELVAPAFCIARDIVEVASVRLEYLDRFWFDGESADADVSALLKRESSVLPPHIFGRPDLWHIHTGAFLAPGSTKRLELVNLDTFDSPAPSQPDGPSRRWVHITTALEDRFLPTPPVESDVGQDGPGLAVGSDIDNGFPFNTFDDMHGALKALLASVITPEVSTRILLTGLP